MAKEKAVTTTTNAVKKEDVKKLSFPKKVAKWWREMKSELKKVIWPTPKTLAKNSFVAVVFMLVSALVLWCSDMVATQAVNLLFKLAG